MPSADPAGGQVASVDNEVYYSANKLRRKVVAHSGKQTSWSVHGRGIPGPGVFFVANGATQLMVLVYRLVPFFFSTAHAHGRAAAMNGDSRIRAFDLRPQNAFVANLAVAVCVRKLLSTQGARQWLSKPLCGAVPLFGTPPAHGIVTASAFPHTGVAIVEECAEGFFSALNGRA